MSEYQYYEFLAVDRALTPREIDAVGKFSSRAEISATRFTNEYHWGDFRGDVENFLTRFYDLHLYYANWGMHIFGLAFPAQAVDVASFKPYLPKGGAAECKARAERVILKFSSDCEGGDYHGSEEASMAELAPLREEILGGDLRPLYLGWLAGIFDDGMYLEDDAIEPPVPAGLQHLTPAQKAFADFMRIDEDLLAVAAETSPPLSDSSVDPRPWLSALAADEKDRFLLAVMEGRGRQVPVELQARFRRSLPVSNFAKTARTAGDLRAAAENATAERTRREAEANARRRAAAEAKAAAERAKYLDEIAPNRAKLWQQVEALIATRLPKSYDACVKILCDLRDVARRQNQVAEYDRRMAELTETHRGKSSFRARLSKAGLV